MHQPQGLTNMSNAAGELMHLEANIIRVGSLTRTVCDRLLVEGVGNLLGGGDCRWTDIVSSWRKVVVGLCSE